MKLYDDENEQVCARDCTLINLKDEIPPVLFPASKKRLDGDKDTIVFYYYIANKELY